MESTPLRRGHGCVHHCPSVACPRLEFSGARAQRRYPANGSILTHPYTARHLLVCPSRSLYHLEHRLLDLRTLASVSPHGRLHQCLSLKGITSMSLTGLTRVFFARFPLYFLRHTCTRPTSTDTETLANVPWMQLAGLVTLALRFMRISRLTDKFPGGLPRREKVVEHAVPLTTTAIHDLDLQRHRHSTDNYCTHSPQSGSYSATYLAMHTILTVAPSSHSLTRPERKLAATNLEPALPHVSTVMIHPDTRLGS